MTDEQLVLMVRILSQITFGKFFGIPEEDVSVKISLKNDAPIKHKVKRLNTKLHQRCRKQLQREINIMIIKDSNLEFALSMLCGEEEREATNLW